MGLPSGETLRALPGPWKHLETSRAVTPLEDLSSPQPQLLLPITPKINLRGRVQLTQTDWAQGATPGSDEDTNLVTPWGASPRRSIRGVSVAWLVE